MRSAFGTLQSWHDGKSRVRGGDCTLRELITGAMAVVRGALVAGCGFFAGYPITPATPILLHMLQEMPKVGGIAVQGEDEISSIGMCLGAAAAGLRAMTATSGPGISLFSENVGLAIMAELPLVIVDVQRLGPATGGATTVAQGDVQFVRWGTGGGYPLIVLAPDSVEACLNLTVEAFHLAHRFRCPVVLLTDKEMILDRTTVELDDNGMEKVSQPCATALGVEPLVPFGGDTPVRFTGSTHDLQAMITKEPEVVRALNRRLLAKIEDHRVELSRALLDLQPGARTLIVGYGVTARAVRTAVQQARDAGYRVSGAVVQSLWPAPRDALRRAAAEVERVLVAELNPGLYTREIQRILPHVEVIGVHRLDGQLVASDVLVAACGRG